MVMLLVWGIQSHALRRNMNMTYIVMDNQIYGLTKGQTSPSSAVGFVTKTTPKGNIEKNVAPLELALSSWCHICSPRFFK
ncbi:2-oxoglutarate oxidoreductase, beta subunit [Staphylococcus aureus]|nr:2-oxoglutarate oxidoreductase, beta subunit [Staphylococcus aureus]